MERHVLLLTILSLVLGLLVGWLAGRRTNRAVERLRDLEAELDASRAELEIYRERVVEHFSRSSELLRTLTLQYRDVYEHLADGARTLCPDDTPALGQGIEAALVTEKTASDEPASKLEPAREPPSS